MNTEQKYNVFKEHKDRFLKPWCHSFALYFGGIIIILGGIGVLVSIFSGNDIMSITSNLSTYSIALLAPAIISISLSAHKSKYQVSWNIVTALVLLTAALLLYLSHGDNSLISIISSSISTLIAWAYWIIANYDNISLNDEAFHEKITTEIKENHATNWK